jgi:hypothetical protein
MAIKSTVEARWAVVINDGSKVDCRPELIVSGSIGSDSIGISLWNDSDDMDAPSTTNEIAMPREEWFKMVEAVNIWLAKTEVK